MTGILEIAGGILAIGFAFRLLDWRPRQKPVKREGAWCQCGHGLHDHDPETHRCHGRIKLYRYTAVTDEEVLDRYGDCTCRQYDGPEKLPEYYLPELEK